MATLKDRQWFEYPIDRGIPKRVVIYERLPDKKVNAVTTITKMQALALKRWHGYQGVYWGRKDGNGRWIDVRVVGDVEAWMGDD